MAGSLPRKQLHKVTAFRVVGPHRLHVEFADGLSRVIDFRLVLEGELYGLLRDLAVFNQVALDPEVHTLTWPNGADFDPATLHDWPEHEAQFIALAQRWAASGRSSAKPR